MRCGAVRCGVVHCGVLHALQCDAVWFDAMKLSLSNLLHWYCIATLHCYLKYVKSAPQVLIQP